jgi:hypothetical protein
MTYAAPVGKTEPAPARKARTPFSALRIGKPDDPLERQANRVAGEASNAPTPTWPLAPRLKPAHPSGHAPHPSGMPGMLDDVLRLPGRPLDSATRALIEPLLGYDFSQVRVHTDAPAVRSASALNARAFTVGDHIGFAAGEYSPSSDRGRGLLAHELTHVVQQAAAGCAALQRQPASGSAQSQSSGPAASNPAPPRDDYVFIMGDDRPGSGSAFYKEALGFYKARVPGATFVTNIRSLADLLAYVRATGPNPIGNIYIISHANEDGTLSFGLTAADADAHVDAIQLREAIHPKGGGPGGLPDASRQIDGATRIHIKGCDIGRTQQMVELIDEAFGGAGTVTAPMHEQDFGHDATLGEAERTRLHDEKMAAFKATLPALPEVDPKLKGKERAAAVAARAKATQGQQSLTLAEEQRIKPELDEAAERAATYESFSGPMFQRPGTTLYTAAELLAEVKKLYTQLNEKQQAALASKLAAPDPRSESVAQSQKTYHQAGQRVYTEKPFNAPYTDVRSLAEAQIALKEYFKERYFTPTKMAAPTMVDDSLHVDFEGHFAPPGKDPYDGPLFADQPVPDDASVLANGKAELSNPERFAWRVSRTHTSKGMTTATAIAERVIAYLHHASLNPSAHEHFTRPESDPRFYATSTFAPAPPAQPGP